jgi:polysaccharide pyruvyl transferase WcaK-like protein
LPEIAVFGEWNTTNLGDRGIHAGVVEFLAGCGWGARSYGLGSLTPVPPPGAPSDPSSASAARASAILGAAPPLKRAVRSIRQRLRMRALATPLESAAAIMVGGGALLSDSGLHFPQSLAALAATARRLRRPVLCLGCSADGPWSPRGGRKIREFLAACAVVAVRDQATAERLATVFGRPVPVFGDFCLSEAWRLNGRAGSGERAILAINARRLPPPWCAAQGHYEESLVRLARRLTQTSGRRAVTTVRVFTTGVAEDTIPAQRVAPRVGDGAPPVIPGQLDALRALLGASALVVASRLHAGILALTEGAPIVGFSPQPKLRRFLATLDLDDYAFDLDDGDQAVRRLGELGDGALFASQRDRIVRAPIWGCRAQVREVLGSLAAGQGQCS